MNNKELLSIIENFKNKKIGVIGDLILDQFVWGDSQRISAHLPYHKNFPRKCSYITCNIAGPAGQRGFSFNKHYWNGRFGRNPLRISPNKLIYYKIA